MRRLVCIIAWPLFVLGAVVIDRIAVIAGTHVIKLSDIDRDIRLTDFLNRATLDFSAAAKRQSAERLITQDIIRDEIVNGGYRRPPESEAAALETDLRRDRFGSSELRLEAALQRDGLTEPELRQELLWQITVLQFINQRFRGGVVVNDADVKNYYDQHLAELKREYPNDYSLEALTPKIRGQVEGERINQQFNEWLDEARKNYHVEFKQGAFE